MIAGLPMPSRSIAWADCNSFACGPGFARIT
jgi:hypothetical protein